LIKILESNKMNSKSLKSAAIIFALCSGASATSIEHK